MATPAPNNDILEQIGTNVPINVQGVDNKTKGLIVIVLVLIIIAAVLYFFVFNKKEEKEEQQQ